MPSKMVIQDGIIEWFNGPEWDNEAFIEFEVAAKDIEAKAQSEAPWADRTGNARNGLTAEASNNGGVIRLSLFHTVSYGFWLEVIQNGRFAIIMPILEREGRRISYNAIRRIRYARRGRAV